MNVYKFREGEIKPFDSRINSPDIPEGFIVIGNGDVEIDWTLKSFVNGNLVNAITEIPVFPTEQLTEEEVLNRERSRLLWEIQLKLQNTDYQLLKFMDGALTEEEYAPSRSYRSTLRGLYNAIHEMKTLEEVHAVVVPDM